MTPLEKAYWLIGRLEGRIELLEKELALPVAKRCVSDEADPVRLGHAENVVAFPDRGGAK